MALCEYRGGPVAVEVKGVLPSCWTLGREAGLAERMAHGRNRSPDPLFHYHERYVIRRLAPNSRKLTLDEVGSAMLRRLIAAMGAELAAVHAETGKLARTIRRDLGRRKGNWLEQAAIRVADWTAGEHAKYRKSR